MDKQFLKVGTQYINLSNSTFIQTKGSEVTIFFPGGATKTFIDDDALTVKAAIDPEEAKKQAADKQAAVAQQAKDDAAAKKAEADKQAADKAKKA